MAFQVVQKHRRLTFAFKCKSNFGGLGPQLVGAPANWGPITTFFRLHIDENSGVLFESLLLFPI